MTIVSKTIPIHQTRDTDIAIGSRLTQARIPIAARIIGGITYGTALSDTFTVRWLAIIISATANTAPHIPFHHADGGVIITAGIVLAIAEHADFIDTLTGVTATIGIVLTAHTAVPAHSRNTYRRCTIAAIVVGRITYCARPGYTLALSARAIAIGHTCHTLKHARFQHTELTGRTARVIGHITADARPTITDGRILIGALIIGLTRHAFKARRTLHTIGRIGRAARPIKGVTQLAEIVHTLG